MASMAYSTADIRNIALVGQAGAGKTLLAESLLTESGAVRSRGSLERGTTVCDFDPQEHELRHSLDAAIVHFDVGACRVNLIDTPGYPDFAGRALSVLEAVETAAVVVSAVNGIEPVTQRMMEFARDRELCRLIVINKIDSKDAKPEQVLADLRETFGRECLPLNLPADGGRSVVDCFFTPGAAQPDFNTVAAAHTEIIDQVVEIDEQLMAPPPFLKGEGPQAERVQVTPDAERHVIAHVFKITIDPFVGRLGVFRVHQGTVRTGSQLFVGDARKPFKVAHLYQLQGKDHAEITRAIPGDLCAVAKVDELHFDAVLHDSHDEDHYHLKSITFPPAMAGLAIEPEKRGEEQKLSDALHKLVAEDPCVRVEHHASMNETVLYGMGDLLLRVMLQRMGERYGVRCKTHVPSIPYKETITRAAPGHHRHKKQTGGAGQFGEVYLRVEPLERGQGFEFVDEVVGGAIPNQFIPAVEKGVRQILGEGAIAGFPVQDLRVIVYDGKYHAVDSKEVAFVSAGRRAFLNGFREAGPIVLEPVVRIEVTTPTGATGDITGDLATRRGRVSGTQSLAGQRNRISALVPLAELTDYQARVKSLTGGEGTYTMELSHYDPVPPRKQQELMKAFKQVEEE
jgi:elongation factor G